MMLLDIFLLNYRVEVINLFWRAVTIVERYAKSTKTVIMRYVKNVVKKGSNVLQNLPRGACLAISILLGRAGFRLNLIV